MVINGWVPQRRENGKPVPLRKDDWIPFCTTKQEAESWDDNTGIVHRATLTVEERRRFTGGAECQPVVDK